MPRYDVAIIGGGVVGSSVAYFVKQLTPGARVAVIERDSTYEFASTLRASGGARRQFSCPENIAMSNFSIPFIANADTMLAVEGESAHVEWRTGGYLLIVGPDAVDTLRANHDLQRVHDVAADWLDADALRARFPSMNVDGIAAGVHTPGDGWCDPNGLLQGLRRKARVLGVDYIDALVVGIDHDGGIARGVRVDSGAVVSTDHVVNAAGAWSREIAAMGWATGASPRTRLIGSVASCRGKPRRQVHAMANRPQRAAIPGVGGPDKRNFSTSAPPIGVPRSQVKRFQWGRRRRVSRAARTARASSS